MEESTGRIGEERATGRASTADAGESVQSTRGINQMGTASREMVQAYRQSTRNSNNSIICMTANAQSLVLKKDDLKEKVRLHKPLIIGITETWAGEGMDDGVFKLDASNDKKKKCNVQGRQGVREGGRNNIIYINTTWTEGMPSFEEANKSSSI